MKPPREGEERLGFDPASRADASVHFIGHIRSDWREGDVPRNLPRAREEGGDGHDQSFRRNSRRPVRDQPHRVGLADLPC